MLSSFASFGMKALAICAASLGGIFIIDFSLCKAAVMKHRLSQVFPFSLLMEYIITIETVWKMCTPM
jgi:hypothetical protein